MLRARSPFDFPRMRSARSGQALAQLVKTRGIGMTFSRKVNHTDSLPDSSSLLAVVRWRGQFLRDRVETTANFGQELRKRSLQN